jgi:hypothetical protein
MTEELWLSSVDPEPMLYFLGRKPSRKLKLFGCACLRRIWHLLTDQRCRRLVEVAERDADGRVRPGTRADVIQQAKARGPRDDADRYGLFAFWALRDWMELRGPRVLGHVKTADIARWSVGAAGYDAFRASGQSGAGLAVESPIWVAAEAAARAAQATLLRDLFGPLPFREVRIDPGWLAWYDGAVRKLAQVIYDERILPEGLLDQSRLAILADALEEAGCDNEEILAHCRSRSDHVRGCWLIDLILGKS